MFDNLCRKFFVLVFLGTVLLFLPLKVVSPYGFSFVLDPLISGENTILTILGYSYPHQRLGTLISEEKGDLERFKMLVEFYYPEKKEGLTKLAQCESSFVHKNKWGDNGLSYGIFQFQKRTFDYYCSGDWKDINDQIHCAVKLIEKGLGATTIGWYNCWRKNNLWVYFKN